MFLRRSLRITAAGPSRSCLQDSVAPRATALGIVVAGASHSRSQASVAPRRTDTQFSKAAVLLVGSTFGAYSLWTSQASLSEELTPDKDNGRTTTLIKQFVARLPPELQTDDLPTLRVFLQTAPETFWSRTLPSIQRLAVKAPTGPQILCAGVDGTISVTRGELAALIAQAFTLERPGRYMVSQSNMAPGGLNRFSFFELFSKQPEEYLLAKLKMFCHYFDHFARNVKCDEIVIVHRRSIPPEILKSQLSTLTDKRGALSRVEVFSGSELDSEKLIMTTVAFANALPGAGVLADGKLQEPILFATRPELLLASLVCERMRENEAILVDGAAMFAKHNGLRGPAVRDAGPADVESPAMPVLLIDALDFRGREQYQYSLEALHRELGKALIGFGLTPASMPIGSGSWGCGAFKGDPQLEFVLQWLAASLSGRPLNYVRWDSDKKALGDAAKLKTFVAKFTCVQTGQLWKTTLEWAARQRGCPAAGDVDVPPLFDELSQLITFDT